MNREQIDKLADLYGGNIDDAYIVATICDTILDESGALLGEVRKVARERIFSKKMEK